MPPNNHPVEVVYPKNELSVGVSDDFRSEIDPKRARLERQRVRGYQCPVYQVRGRVDAQRVISVEPATAHLPVDATAILRGNDRRLKRAVRVTHR